MQIEYKNPVKRTGIFIWEADVNPVSRKSGFGIEDTGKDEEETYGENVIYLPGSSAEEKFFVWISLIKDWETQRETELNYSIEGKVDYEDKENGNTVGFYDFSKNILGRKQLKINFSFQAYEAELKMESWNTKEYERSSSLYRKYTKGERQLSQANDIVELAEKITREQVNYFSKAKMMYNWITENVKYKNTDTKRGAIKVFRSGDGNAAEISFLCITLMRAVGIPTRLVTGAWGGVGKKQDLHFWLEFYLQEVGWVPVDCTKKMFAKIDNKRIIFSKGENIFLEKSPEESNLFGIKYKRVFYMQPEAVYLNKKGSEGVTIKQSKYLLVKE